jgi:hypothetical protein
VRITTSRTGDKGGDAPEGDVMSGTESGVCGRDRAVLRAVANGRCELRAGCEPVLIIDGLSCADSATVHRLIGAGLIVPPNGPAIDRARLTPAGRAIVGSLAAG